LVRVEVLNERVNLQTKELYFFNEYFEGEETLSFTHSVTLE